MSVIQMMVPIRLAMNVLEKQGSTKLFKNVPMSFSQMIVFLSDTYQSTKSIL